MFNEMSRCIDFLRKHVKLCANNFTALMVTLHTWSVAGILRCFYAALNLFTDLMVVHYSVMQCTSLDLLTCLKRNYKLLQKTWRCYCSQ